MVVECMPLGVFGVYKAIGELQQRGVESGLSGPLGNAFNLLAVACKTTGRDPVPLLAEMMAADYVHLLKAFERFKKK